MKLKLLILLITISGVAMAQNKELPYYEIPEMTEAYTAGTVAARMVDALGFRFFWESEGLRTKDLEYKASSSSRTSAETIEHIFGMSQFILNTISKEPKTTNKEPLSFKAQREQTLLNLKKASDILRVSNNLEQYDTERVQFWNMINGPISDAIWHCGQLVTLRRASGNSFNSNINLFSGKIRN